jgi:hypothetical protein
MPAAAGPRRPPTGRPARATAVRPRRRGVAVRPAAGGDRRHLPRPGAGGVGANPPPRHVVR